MKHNKRLLSILLAVMMVLGLAVTAHADDAFVYTKTTKVQITKTLKIGQGITVPNEDFEFTFTPATTAEATELGEEGTFIDPSKTQHGVADYPALTPVTIHYDNNTRTTEGTDEELTFVSNEIDFNTLNVNWPEIGLYIYSVKETPGNTAGMTYDSQNYFVKVYVKNASSGTGKEVDAVAVYGKNDNNEWVKVDGAPKTATETAEDGCADYVGN